MVLEMKIIKQRLEFEECLKQRLKFICELSKVTPTFINSSIRLVICFNFSVLKCSISHSFHLSKSNPFSTIYL